MDKNKHKMVSFRLDIDDYEMLTKWCKSDGYENNISLYVRQMIQAGHDSRQKSKTNNNKADYKSKFENPATLTLDDIYTITYEDWESMDKDDQDAVKSRRAQLFTEREKEKQILDDKNK